MTLPSGTISLSQVNTELTLSATALISLNDAAVRSLAGVASGAISMSDLQGKTYNFTFSISANAANVNLRTAAIAAGWNQTIPVVATIETGVVISSSSTATDALTINGAWAGGVTLVNNGTIVGKGGLGGSGGSGVDSASAQAAGTAGAPGGRALLVSSAVSINNTSGVIGGGGGGGGGGGAAYTTGTYGQQENTYYCYTSGGGGGGGAGAGGAGAAGSGSGGTDNAGNTVAVAGTA